MKSNSMDRNAIECNESLYKTMTNDFSDNKYWVSSVCFWQNKNLFPIFSPKQSSLLNKNRRERERERERERPKIGPEMKSNG